MNFIIAGGVAALGYYNQENIINKIKTIGLNSYLKATEWYVQIKDNFNYIYKNDYYLDKVKLLKFDDEFNIQDDKFLSINYNDTFDEVVNKYKETIDDDIKNNIFLIFKYYIRLKHINKEYYYIYNLNDNNETPDITIDKITQHAKTSSLDSKILSVVNHNDIIIEDSNDNEKDITELFSRYLGPFNNFYNYQNIDFRYLYNFDNDSLIFNENLNKVTLMYCNMNVKTIKLNEINYKCCKFM